MKLKSKLLSLALLAMLAVPSTAFAATNEITPQAATPEGIVHQLGAPVCPVYDDGHRLYNKVFLRTESDKTTHYEWVGDNPHLCTITTTYNVFRYQCACGYYTPSSTFREVVNTSHQWN
ncbi:hypothetical protein [Clostridium sp. OS1-26]|uniref:hypothetical protein n=1 Tax=Clostridium sp. OS1-26 TaxID=3070681 RepID=UPI0027E20710|nr:hypothetical protein [Clostridium sp. OS1-26]WML33192.1 hypothetical protein RCG18_17790 [Clostridium sp. OS1-26]